MSFARFALNRLAPPGNALSDLWLIHATGSGREDASKPIPVMLLDERTLLSSDTRLKSRNASVCTSPFSLKSYGSRRFGSIPPGFAGSGMLSPRSNASTPRSVPIQRIPFPSTASEEIRTFGEPLSRYVLKSPWTTGSPLAGPPSDDSFERTSLSSEKPIQTMSSFMSSFPLSSTSRISTPGNGRPSVDTRFSSCAIAICTSGGR